MHFGWSFSGRLTVRSCDRFDAGLPAAAPSLWVDFRDADRLHWESFCSCRTELQSLWAVRRKTIVNVRGCFIIFLFILYLWGMLLLSVVFLAKMSVAVAVLTQCRALLLFLPKKRKCWSNLFHFSNLRFNCSLVQMLKHLLSYCAVVFTIIHLAFFTLTCKKREKPELSDYCKLLWKPWGRLPCFTWDETNVNHIICSFILYAQAWLT